MNFVSRLAHVCLMTILISASCAAKTSTPTEKPLLTESRRLFTINRIILRYGICEVRQPWISDHELLHFSKNGLLYRFDIDTGTDASLPALTHRITGSWGRRNICPVSVSPDGKWVMWRNDRYGTVHVSPLDGGKMLSWPGSLEADAYWCADNCHILLIPDRLSTSGRTAVTEYDVNTPGWTIKFKIPRSIHTDFSLFGAIAAVSDEKIVSSNPPMALSWVHQSGDKYPQMITTWNLRRIASTRQVKALLPSSPLEVAATPQGDRIAWMISGEDNSKFDVAIWTSNDDGSNVHEIGGLNAVPDGSSKSIDLGYIRWSPSGKNISFVSANSLWVVPAN